MSEIDIHEALGDNAVDAPTPPPDLLDRVETGYRRRRRGRAVTATFLSIVLLAVGGWLVLRPEAQRETLPARPPVTFHVPTSVINAPPLTSVWPNTIMLDSPLPNVPLAGLIRTAGILDHDHLLLVGRSKFYSYDVRAKSMQVLLSDPGVNGQTERLDHFAISPHWIVWQANDFKDDWHRFSVYRMPINGGPRQRIAVVNQVNINQGYYATDEYVYWSPLNGGGVNRLSMTDGKLSTMPGFQGAWIDGSPWVRIPSPTTVSPAPPPILETKINTPTALRNVVTGELRSITTPPDIAIMSCVPTFCVATAKKSNEAFIERLDGSGRIPVPSTQPSVSGRRQVLAFGDGGLAVLDNLTLLDPLTGKLAAFPLPRSAICGFSPGSMQGVTTLSVSESLPSGGNVCRLANHTVYIFGP
jgi:hypothetical protein